MQLACCQRVSGHYADIEEPNGLTLSGTTKEECPTEDWQSSRLGSKPGTKGDKE
jgi:hypothetical protein